MGRSWKRVDKISRQFFTRQTLFGCLKGRGFNFEDTHITDHERIKKLFALLAIAFCWCHKIGEWRHEFHPIKIKKHGRPAISFFRYGLDFIIGSVMNFFQRSNFLTCLDSIKPPMIHLYPMEETMV